MRDGLRWRHRAMKNEELLDEILRLCKVGNWSAPPNVMRERLLTLLQEEELADV